MRTLFWPVIAGLLMGTAVYYSADAHADPLTPNVAVYAASNASAVCATLDDYPTVAGVAGVAEGVMADGFTAYQAGEILAVAVEARCPRHIPLLRRFADAVTPPSSGVNA